MKITSITTAIVCIASLCTLSASAQQPPIKVKEYGLGFSGLNNFSLQYRWGDEKHLYRATGTIGGSTGFGKSSNSSSNINNGYINTQSANSTNKSPLYLDLGLYLSSLKLRAVNEKFGVLYGAIIGASYNSSSSEYSITGTSTDNISGILTTYPVKYNSKVNAQTVRGTIGMALGVYYKINTSFLVYAEIDPNIYYAYSTINNSTSTTQEVAGPPNTVITGNDKTSHDNTIGLSGLSNSFASITLAYRIAR